MYFWGASSRRNANDAGEQVQCETGHSLIRRDTPVSVIRRYKLIRARINDAQITRAPEIFNPEDTL